MAERAHPDDPGFKNRWFGLKRNPYRQKLFERYELCNELVSSRVVLDLPCGTGWGTALLKGYRFAWGIDIAEDAIAYAKRRYEKKGRLEGRCARSTSAGLSRPKWELVRPFSSRFGLDWSSAHARGLRAAK